MNSEIRMLSPYQMQALMQSGDPPYLVDVRSHAEYRDGHADGAISIPVDDLNRTSLQRKLPGWEPDRKLIYLICESGVRAREAAERLRLIGLRQLALVEGGTAAWRAAGLPVTRLSRLPSLERQTQIALGAVLLLILVKGALIHPGFYLLIGLVAVGLVSAGITARCSLNTLLARMPWNRQTDNTA